MRSFTITTTILFLFCLPLIAQADPNDQTATETNLTTQTVTEDQPAPAPTGQTITPEQLKEYENKILDKADKYYEKALTRTFMFLGAALTLATAFVGWVMPWWFEKERQKTFKKEQAELVNKLDALTADKIRSAKHDLEASAEKNKQHAARGLGMLFVAQSDIYHHREIDELEMLHLMFACYHSVEAKDFEPAQRTSNSFLKRLRDTQNPRQLDMGTLGAIEHLLNDINEKLSKLETTDTTPETNYVEKTRNNIKSIERLVHARMVELEKVSDNQPTTTGQ